MIDAYLSHLLILIAIYSILAVSLDLAVGFTGLLNMGHVAFYGIGAYASALLALNGYPFLLAMLGGALLAALSGALLAMPTTKLKGDYLALTTLGFGFIAQSFMKNWTSLTRGPLGLPGIPKPEILGFSFSSNEAYLALATLLAAITAVTVWKVENSPFGRVLEAVRDNEIAAKSLGKNAFKVKTVALTISGFFAGIAGSLYAHYITFIDPTTFNILEIILLFSIIIIGGLASVKGAIAGTFLLTLLPEPLRFLPIPNSVVGPLRQIIYALILLLVIYFYPKGVFGKVSLEDQNA